jgi:uncharacterized protein with PIN domain
MWVVVVAVVPSNCFCARYSAQLRAIPHFLLTGRDIHEQFIEVAQHFELTLDPESFLCRCTKCNGTFTFVTDNETVRHIVLDAVMERVAEFWQCNRCGQVGTAASAIQSLNTCLTCECRWYGKAHSSDVSLTCLKPSMAIKIAQP